MIATPVMWLWPWSVWGTELATRSSSLFSSSCCEGFSPAILTGEKQSQTGSCYFKIGQSCVVSPPSFVLCLHFWPWLVDSPFFNFDSFRYAPIVSSVRFTVWTSMYTVSFCDWWMALDFTFVYSTLILVNEIWWGVSLGVILLPSRDMRNDSSNGDIIPTFAMCALIIASYIASWMRSVVFRRSYFLD